MSDLTASPHPRSFWSSLTDVEQWELQTSAQRMGYAMGEVLCGEGEAADSVVVIQSGWTKVCVKAAGRERILAVRGAGDLIGERAVLSVRARSASVIALTPVRALVVAAEVFAAFLASHPRVATVLERQVYDRLTEERGPIFTAEPAEPAEGRLASLVLELVLRHGGADDRSLATLTLPISPRDLASWADLPLATVSQVLTAWRGRRLIRGSRRGRITITDVGALLNKYGRPVLHPPQPSPAGWSGQNCSILFVDIAGFGAHDRDDEDRRLIRAQMYDFVRDALETSKASWEEIYWEDRGDGMLIVAPPALPTTSILDPALAELAARLRRHNRQASGGPVRMQLRLAVTVGPVVRDDYGVSGESIFHAARLLDASVLKEQLARTAADLGVIVSTFVYDTVVKHGPGLLDPAAFQQVTCRVKESQITAWMHLAGTGPVSMPAQAETTRGGGARDHRSRTGPTINGNVYVAGDLVQGPTIKIQYGPRTDLSRRRARHWSARSPSSLTVEYSSSCGRARPRGPGAIGCVAGPVQGRNVSRTTRPKISLSAGETRR